MNAMVPVRFHEDTVWAVDVDGVVYVALKPICENLSLDWSSQHKRLIRDALLSKGMVVMTIPSPGGEQQTTCLPLDLVPGWLFGIDDRRIADPAIREKVLAYKLECYRVLYEHFFAAPAPEPEPPPAEPFGLDEHVGRINAHVHLVRLCERLKGKAAANRLWAMLGLPDPGPDEPGLAAGGWTSPHAADRTDLVRRFLAECTVPDRRASVPAEVMRRAYGRWAAAHGAPELSAVGLGMALARAGVAKRKASCTEGRTQVYFGLRLTDEALAGGPVPAPEGAWQ